MAEVASSPQEILQEAEGTVRECETSLNSPRSGWNATHVFNCARKATKAVRALSQLAHAGPLVERLLLARGGLLSRLTRIQRTEASLSAYLNQSHENYHLMELRQMISSDGGFYKDGMTVSSCLDYAAFQESCAAFANEPQRCQKGIVALQVSSMKAWRCRHDLPCSLFPFATVIIFLSFCLSLLSSLPCFFPSFLSVGPAAARGAAAPVLLLGIPQAFIALRPRPQAVPRDLPHGRHDQQTLPSAGCGRRHGNAGRIRRAFFIFIGVLFVLVSALGRASLLCNTHLSPSFPCGLSASPG